MGGGNLIKAASSGSLFKVNVCLTAGDNVNALSHGTTALHVACVNGHLDVVQLLLENKADVSVQDKKGRSPLHCACQGHNTKVLSLLLTKRANTNAKDKTGMTPLHIACEADDIDSVRVLLDNRAEPNSQIGTNKGGLASKTPRGPFRRLSTTPVLIHDKTPLMIAISNNNEDLTNLLLDKRATVNVSEMETQPLHIASHVGNPAIVDMLLDRKADVDAKDSEGNTPLHFAQNYETVVRLLHHKPNIFVSNKDRRTAFETCRVLRKVPQENRASAESVLEFLRQDALPAKKKENAKPARMNKQGQETADETNPASSRAARKTVVAGKKPNASPRSKRRSQEEKPGNSKPTKPANNKPLAGPKPQRPSRPNKLAPNTS